MDSTVTTAKKRYKYIEKVVSFGKEKLKVYSIDGQTWSTRKDELAGILERHEAERTNLNLIKGAKPPGAEAVRSKQQVGPGSGSSAQKDPNDDDAGDDKEEEELDVGEEAVEEKGNEGEEHRPAKRGPKPKEKPPALGRPAQGKPAAKKEVKEPVKEKATVSPRPRPVSKGARPAEKPKKAKHAA